MLTYYRRRTDKAHKIVLYFFQRLDSKMDSEMMYIMKKNRKRITVRYNYCLDMFVTKNKRTIKKCTLTGGPEADVLEPFSPLRKSRSVRPENLVL